MHIYFMTRGIKHEVDEFIKQLSCQYLPYKVNKDGKLVDASLQVRLSPIQLWDVSFPVEHKDAMLTTLFGHEMGGKAMNGRHNKYAMLIRKILGVEKIPKDYSTKLSLAPRLRHVESIAIGMKDDYFENGQEMI